MVKVSFVCPVFNKQKYLKDVIDSIKNQKGEFDREFIFINDGSTDLSLEYLKKFTKKFKKVIIIDQNNYGPAVATQQGINVSSGDFLKLVGGDDVLHPDCTNILLNTIIKNKSVGVFSRYELVEDFKKIKFKNSKTSNLKRIDFPLLDTVKSSFSGTSPNLYCNKAIKKSGGCNTKIFVEDFSLVLGISTFGNFCFIDNITSYGPKNDNNRIMEGNKIQLIHDYNAALFYFISKNKNISKNIKKIACKKALGRAEKWGRRLKKKNLLNKMNFLKIKLFFGYENFTEILKSSCLYFYENLNGESIRYKID
ncbi:MAG: hypothetical protein CMP38_05315 [Rickettsiales bacterium]|nr:hypothetical protein [Rickettsiales bacterium]|tara:strand:+ start:1054 stop:1980 length:927 start_codon:yes stop_codon:yes gene_type:complete